MNIPYNSHIKQYIEYIVEKLYKLEFKEKKSIIYFYRNLDIEGDPIIWYNESAIKYSYLYYDLGITDIVDYSWYRRNDGKIKTL